MSTLNAIGRTDKNSLESSTCCSSHPKYSLTALVISVVVAAILATLAAALIVGPKRFGFILPLTISITLSSACIVVLIGVGLSKIKKGSGNKPSIVRLQKPITPVARSFIQQYKPIAKEEPKPDIHPTLSLVSVPSVKAYWDRRLQNNNSDAFHYFSDLPAELKQHILSYLTLSELIVASTVNKDCYAQETEVIKDHAKKYGWEKSTVLDDKTNLQRLCAEIKIVISQTSFFLFVKYLDHREVTPRVEYSADLLEYKKIEKSIEKLPLLSMACSRGTTNLVSLAFMLALPFCSKDLNQSLEDAIDYAVRHSETGLFQEEVNTLVLHLLKRGANPNINHRIMHTATGFGLDQILYLLLAFNGDPDIKNHDNQTPLIRAIDSNKSGKSILNCILLLVERGANPSIPSTRDALTPLHHAACKEDTQIISLLLQNPDADINIKNSRGYTPIIYGVTHGRKGDKENLKLVQFFENAGADLNCQSNSGNTLLHYAAWNLYPELTRYLIQKGLSIDALGASDVINQVTPLHSLFLRNFYLSKEREKIRGEMLRIYLENQANPNIQALDGKTVLHTVINFGKREYVPLLLEYGADPTILDKKGNSAYYYAEKEHMLDLFPDPKP